MKPIMRVKHLLQVFDEKEIALFKFVCQDNGVEIENIYDKKYRNKRVISVDIHKDVVTVKAKDKGWRGWI